MHFWRVVVATPLATLILLAGCARPSTAPYRPVQVPQTPAQSATAPTKPPPDSQPQPVSPSKSSTQPELVEKKPKAAQAPAIKPAPPTLPAEGAPALIKRLAKADWKFASIKTTLPALESSYVDQSGENPEYLTYAYSQGDLRLYVSPNGTVFALLVGPTFAEYKAFESLQPGQGYAVHKVEGFVMVSRFTPVSTQELAHLEAASWTPAQLEQGLGAPTYRLHHHGIGSYTYVWFPQQLAFYGYDTLTLQESIVEAYQTNSDALAEGFARALVSELRYLDAILAKGKASPNQQVRAGIVARGGYWDNWVIVKPIGKAELRFQADYFLLDYLFIDDQTLIYVDRNSDLYAIHLNTGKQEIVTHVKGHVSKFGLAGGRRIWYETDTKERYELDLP